MIRPADRVRHRLGGAAGILCGLVGAFASMQLPLGNARLLGPGAVPLVLSLAMIGLSAAMLLRPAKPEPADEEDGGLHGAAMVGIVVLLIAAFGFLLTRIGFLLSGGLLMYGLYAIGEERVLSLGALVKAVLSMIAAYLLFVVALSVNMPAGSLWGYY
ncbi:tripartite tricarboxylate transporter TctB family protein [Bosea sp. BH3]|uniref:tripartite tricarboxylate transporter TctB family protein n=1 Tax=Bosea sp. BH3 TaxID=2871701 RepID=UPI0021CAE946|nr:tripartite tricarboxylate transporter TctB family protein [Bosea sp. BH3]MCU4181569.1 tripartite tricarboxylate transporter TctB family protein [Bosea sp. BH3]